MADGQLRFHLFLHQSAPSRYSHAVERITHVCPRLHSLMIAAYILYMHTPCIYMHLTIFSLQLIVFVFRLSWAVTFPVFTRFLIVNFNLDRVRQTADVSDGLRLLENSIAAIRRCFGWIATIGKSDCSNPPMFRIDTWFGLIVTILGWFQLVDG